MTHVLTLDETAHDAEALLESPAADVHRQEIRGEEAARLVRERRLALLAEWKGREHELARTLEQLPELVDPEVFAPDELEQAIAGRELELQERVAGAHGVGKLGDGYDAACSCGWIGNNPYRTKTEARTAHRNHVDAEELAAAAEAIGE